MQNAMLVSKFQSKIIIMKKIIFLSIIVALLSSCTAVYFDTPEPANSPKIKEFPEEWVGEYKPKKDTSIVEIGKNYIDLKVFNTRQKFFLCDTMFLKKYKDDFYFVNVEARDRGCDIVYWRIFPVQKVTNKLYVYDIFYSPKLSNTLKKYKINYKEVVGKSIVISNPSDSILDLLFKKRIFKVSQVLKKIEK
jgi:hypothetical protein